MERKKIVRSGIHASPVPEISGEEYFRVLAETTPSSIFIFQDEYFCYVNSATERLTGYNRSELTKMKLVTLFSRESKDEIRKIRLRVQNPGGSLERNEYKINTKNGEERWIDLTIAPIEYNGAPAGLGTAFEITERKRADVLQDAVYRIAQAADRSEHLEDLFLAVHAIIAEVMIANNFFIALYDPKEDHIVFPYYVDQYDPPPGAINPSKGLTAYVLRKGKSLLCTLSVHEELERQGEVSLIGTPSKIWLGVPLTIDNSVIGVMTVQDYENSSAYTIREQRVLEFVSSQVAMAIHRKRDEDALRENEARVRRRADEMSALYETTRDITTQQDPTELLQTLVDRAVSLLGARGGSVYLFDQTRQELELVVAHGYQGYLGARLKVGEGQAGLVAKTLRASVIDDYRTWKHRSNKFDIRPVTSVIAVPIVYSGGLIGVLSAYEFFDSETIPWRKYQQADIDLLSFFAGSAASAIHNARLFSETRQRLIELDVLYQASLAANQIQSVKSVAQRIIDTLEKMLDWEASIWTTDNIQLKPLMIAHFTRGLDGRRLAKMSEKFNSLIQSYENGIVGYVCKHGEIIRTGDVHASEHYIEGSADTKSEMCVPLKLGGKLVGCINVESSRADAFSDHDERLLTTIANHAAIAIENARLFENANQIAVQQAALNTIITAATHAGIDIEFLLATALEETLHALNLEFGAIWLSWSPRILHQIATKGIPQATLSLLAVMTAAGDNDQFSSFSVNEWKDEKGQMADAFLSLGFRATMIAPLLSGDKRVGGLVVASKEQMTWPKDEIAFVENVGREIGAAAERAKLFRETQARLAELEAINRVSTTLRLTRTLGEMLPELIDETLRALETDTGSIWLYSPESNKLKQVIGRGWCAEAMHVELEKGVGIPGTVFSTSDILFSRDVHLDPVTSPALRPFVPAGWGAVCVPILSENETIGVLFVSGKGREFSGQQSRLLVTLTDMAGNAITRLRLYEQTEKHATELETRVAARTAELRDALEKMQEADRLKSEFIINVNHELRTPLTNLILYHQMLRVNPAVKTNDRLDVIGRELQRLRILIEDLLNLSRFDLDQVMFTPMPQDLNYIVETLINDRMSLAEERNLRIKTELSPDLPAVWLDEPMIVQAVSNLVTNAMNYTPAGGQIDVRTSRVDSEWVSVTILDDGLGISEDELPHLFDRFFRGKAGHASGAPGTGLGLAIVKQVIERHSGRIEVGRNVNGRGAKFTIILPRINKQEPN